MDRSICKYDGNEREAWRQRSTKETDIIERQENNIPYRQRKLLIVSGTIACSPVESSWKSGFERPRNSGENWEKLLTRIRRKWERMFQRKGTQTFTLDDKLKTQVRFGPTWTEIRDLNRASVEKAISATDLAFPACYKNQIEFIIPNYMARLIKKKTELETKKFKLRDPCASHFPLTTNVSLSASSRCSTLYHQHSRRTALLINRTIPATYTITYCQSHQCTPLIKFSTHRCHFDQREQTRLHHVISLPRLISTDQTFRFNDDRYRSASGHNWSWS